MNGTAASPASRSVSRRRSGSLSGEPKCGPPRAESRSEDDSNMIPWDALTRRSRARSAASITPGFKCGSNPVPSSTVRAARSRYSSVVSQPSDASSSRAAR